MFVVVLAITFLYKSVHSASYQRFGENTQYPLQTTVSNLYNQNQFPYKTNYGSDIATFPEATRYPNYKPGYSSMSPDIYSTARGNVYLPQGYTTPNYGYGQNQGFGQGYNGQSYGQGYNNPTFGQGYSSYEMPFMQYNKDYCVNRSPQTGIWVDSLTGMWYGVEYVQHLAGDARVDYARSCIVIHISEPMDKPSTENQLFHVQHINAKFRQEYRHIRLLWDEAGQTIEYGLYFRNNSAGYWQAFDRQNGSLTIRPQYQQFSGTVQVLKAVNDHLVLNFCQEASGSVPAQLYSVLFSREPGSMLRWEIDAVHALLQNKKLSVASRRMVCGNNADKPLTSIVFSLLSCILAYVISAS